MDGYLRQFTLDVNAENNHQRIPAKQGDAVNRQLEITLLKDGVAFEPAGVASYAFRCEKPDGTAVVLEGTGSGVPIQAEGSGKYIITLADQCLAVAGRVICDFADGSHRDGGELLRHSGLPGKQRLDPVHHRQLHMEKPVRDFGYSGPHYHSRD